MVPVTDLESLPPGQAVYIIWPKQGEPYLGRTNILRRRLTRLFEKWKLAEHAGRIEYWPTASRLEQWLVSYKLAKQYFPETYERVLRLPKPPYVKLILSNDFPRTQTTTRLAGAKSVFFGPFPNRASADLFESQFLDLFQLRRCQEDLVPSPDHPGCIYGEMGRCLRPCQQAVTIDEYSSEARRVAEFLTTRGATLLESAAAARERSSNDLNFEEASRQHERHQKIGEIAKLPGELARDVTELHGVAVTASIEDQTVMLWFLREGCWLDPVPFSVAPIVGKPVPLDTRLREIVAALETPKATLQLRQDHLALLTKWFYSSWRDGEWLSFDDLAKISYRKLVNAIHRVATASNRP